MPKPITLSASILAANMAKLGEQSLQAIKAGSSEIHFDVMDNHFVPNLTIGSSVCHDLKQCLGANTPIDVHLMVQNPDSLIPSFAQAGASNISIHPENHTHIDRSLQLIKELGVEAGLALNPATHPSILDYCAPYLDRVLVMLVNPGFGGQAAIDNMMPKIEWIKKYFPKLTIQVDGGIKSTNIADYASLGVTNFVAGSAIFSNNHIEQNVKELLAALN